MQKKIVVFVFCVFWSLASQAQAVIGNTEQARTLYTKAKNYVLKRDYPNAILVYNQLARLEPQNLIYRRELAYTYYLGGDMSRATQVITPLLRAKEADEATFLTAAQIFNARSMRKQAVDAIERGIKKYPTSGILYSDYGKLFSEDKKYQKAEMAWEKGVKYEPNFHMNYYNLAKSYFVSKRPLWAIIYGETFINMERYSQRTEEVKKIVFDSYKQLIANSQLSKFVSEKEQRKIDRHKSDFEMKTSKIYTDLANVVMGGVDIDNVVMLRTRFLLRWMQVEQQAYPFHLFDFSNEMVAAGHFEAYNQWLFGKASGEQDFIKWVKNNSEEYSNFEQYFQAAPYKNMPDQYYK